MRLKDNCYTHYGGNYSEKLESIGGQWIEIDTTHLFREQLNTKPIPKVSAVGLRIYQQDVVEVEDDERIGRSKCDYCGAWVDTGRPCQDCQNGLKYMIEFFSGTKRQPKTVVEEIDGLLGDIFTGAQ